MLLVSIDSSLNQVDEMEIKNPAGIITQKPEIRLHWWLPSIILESPAIALKITRNPRIWLPSDAISSLFSKQMAGNRADSISQI
jgi:hypothetical protein